MKRLIGIGLVLAAAATVLVLGTGAGNGGAYRVRARFDNAFSVIPGEDVKIAGVKVGKIESLDVDGKGRNVKAAVVLRIDRAGFQDFRTDAECAVRPQSLIGEKFVECKLTAPRPPGAAAPGPLPKIRDGKGKGQRLLTVEHTASPIDLDLVNNTLRLPYRQRLSIILGELGTTVAGRGRDIVEAIHRANPALRETDRVLKLLADQNRALADLARDSDTVMAPLARDRARIADLVVQANDTAQATAERGDDLERTLQRFPGFLTELRPTIRRLGALADQATPVVSDLGAVAPSINSFVAQLGPFTRSATPALRTLGTATDVGRPALLASRPTIRDLGDFAARARPVGAGLGALLSSFQSTGGVEQLLGFVFNQTAAMNGFDAFGHYLRANLLVNNCTSYASTPVTGCSANFSAPAESAAATAASSPPPVAAPAKAAAAPAPPIPATGGPNARSGVANGPSTELLDYLLGPDR